MGLSAEDGSLIVTFESKSVKYSLDAELEEERLFTAEPNQIYNVGMSQIFKLQILIFKPLLEDTESFPNLEFSELDFDSVQANESLLTFLPSI